jgi:hypothetical protein
MGDIGSAIKYLYGQFILRDVLSSITPGAIVVLTAFLILISEPTVKDSLEKLFEYSRAIHWLLYIPIFGLFYVIGFAVECLERLFGIRMHKLDESSFRQRLSIFCGNLVDKSDINKKWRGKSTKFLWMSSDHDWAGQNYERLVVLKQMCASNFGAIIIASLFLIVDACCPFRYANISIASLIAILLLVALYWGYRDFTIAVTTMEDNFKSLKNEGKLREDK